MSGEPAIVGLVPAAGRARRLAGEDGAGGIGGSKELVPVLFPGPDTGTAQPRPVVHHLLGAFRRAGIDSAVIVLRDGKWDVAAHLLDGAAAGVRLGYVIVPPTPHVPASLDAAYPFVAGRLVALGFPDLLFAPADGFGALRERRRSGRAEVVLGLVPTTRTEKTDMVETDADGAVRRIVVKERGVPLRYNWSIALWTPAFTEFLHAWVAGHPGGAPDAREPAVSDVLLAAMAAGWRIDTVAFPEGRYLDVGTPEDLLAAWREPWNA